MQNLNQNQTQNQAQNQNQNQNQTQTQNQIQNQIQTQNQNLLLTVNSIYLIEVALFTHMIKQKNIQMFVITMQNIECALIKKKCSDSADLLLIIYYEFLNMFS